MVKQMLTGLKSAVKDGQPAVERRHSRLASVMSLHQL